MNIRSRIEQAIDQMPRPCPHNSIGACTSCEIDVFMKVLTNVIDSLVADLNNANDIIESEKSNISALREFRRAASDRIRALEQQLADAAASGLSVRENFAGMAMQGIIYRHPHTEYGNAAQWSVLYADALMAALGVKS